MSFGIIVISTTPLPLLHRLYHGGRCMGSCQAAEQQLAVAAVQRWDVYEWPQQHNSWPHIALRLSSFHLALCVGLS